MGLFLTEAFKCKFLDALETHTFYFDLVDVFYILVFEQYIYSTYNNAHGHAENNKHLLTYFVYSY